MIIQHQGINELAAGYVDAELYQADDLIFYKDYMQTRFLNYDDAALADTTGLLRHSQPRLDTVLMEARTEIGAAEPHAALPLQVGQAVLGIDRRAVEQRVLVVLHQTHAIG